MKRIASRLLIVGLICAPLASAPAAETPAAAVAKPTATGPKKGEKADEITGFDKSAFGSSLADAKKSYPKAEEIPEGKDLGAPTVGGPYIRRLLLTDQKVEGLPKPTMVELRFWKNKLWGVVVYLGDNDEPQVIEILTKRLGPSDSTDTDYPLWVRSKTQTTMERKQRWYGVNDLALSTEAQAWFAKLLHGEWKNATPEELAELGL